MGNMRLLTIGVSALFIICNVVITTALQVRPTESSLTIEIGDDVICMYSQGKDFYEGVSMHYRVVYGGDDFDVFIRDHKNKTIYASYAGEHGLEERIYFTTYSQREHAYCIDNRRYSKAVKHIRIDIGLTSLKRWKSRIDPLQKFMTRSEGYFLGLHDEQIMLRLQEQSLREQIEDVFDLMKIRSVIEVLAVIAVAAVNVFLVTRLFARRAKSHPS